MLNLRQVGQTGSAHDGDMPASQISMPSFAAPESRITGNLGEDLQDSTTDPGSNGSLHESEADPYDLTDPTNKSVDLESPGDDIGIRSHLPEGIIEEMVGNFLLYLKRCLILRVESSRINTRFFGGEVSRVQTVVEI